MNWKLYWNHVAKNSKDLIASVQRKDMESTQLTASHIVSTLQINEKESVLDVCCGNGLLTELIAPNCRSITGIDQSEVLIDSAKQNLKSKNTSYILGDALHLSELIPEKKYDKIYLQFSFQYFDKRGMGEKVIKEMLNVLKPKGLLFIGDIPDAKKRFVFYNNLPKIFYLITSKLRSKNSMGKFWSVRALDAICKKNNAKGIAMKQPKALAYAWYRFDYLITNQ